MTKACRDSSSPRVRGLGVVFRTAHIAGMALYAGGLFFEVAYPLLFPWLVCTVAAGLGLLSIEVSHSRHWVYQGRGVMTLAHIGAFGLIYLCGPLLPALVMATIILGSVGSHMPRALRKWSFVHRQVLE